VNMMQLQMSGLTHDSQGMNIFGKHAIFSSNTSQANCFSNLQKTSSSQAIGVVSPVNSDLAEFICSEDQVVKSVEPPQLRAAPPSAKATSVDESSCNNAPQP